MLYTKNRKSRKGFSLVELVVVILIIAILAVAVFAGGSAAIKKSQVSRTTSDLHNFSVAIEAFMNEHPEVANSQGTAHFADFVADINDNLATDYQVGAEVTADETANITYDNTAAANVKVYKTAKTDAWGNYYYLVLDSGERHGENNSDFYIYVISAGPDAKTALAGVIGGSNAAEADDIFLLAQYENGDVAAFTYDMSKTDSISFGKDGGIDGTVDRSTGTARYCMVPAAGIQNLCPVNF